MLVPMTLEDRQRLGRYELLGELGRGAMGVVYLAQDPLIGRQVALKVFRVGFDASHEELRGLYARFIREAQSAGILSHPNIVTVHDVAPADGETPAFIAMEYVEGRTLKEILDSPESISYQQAADIVVQIAAALQYAHSMGVVHRDIKPGNLLITSEGAVKITDFGIAVVNAPNTTNHGQLLGTPSYMAPEAIAEEPLDHRADLFSLGVVLYELLARHKPFPGKSSTTITHRIVYEPFTPITDYVRGLPDLFVETTRRALEKKPERRFQSAAEMAAALEPACAGRVESPPPRESGTEPVVPVDTQSVRTVSAPRPSKMRRVAALLRRATAVGNVPLWLLVGSIVVGVALGVWLSGSDASPPADAMPVAQPAVARLDPFAPRVAGLERLASQQLEGGDLRAAYYSLAEAVRLRPADALLGERLDRVERDLAARRQSWQLDLDDQLQAAWRALEDGRIRDARQFATLARKLDPMSLEVPFIEEEVVVREARLEMRRRATPPPARVTAVVEKPVVKRVAQPVAPAQPDPAAPRVPVPTSASLRVRLETARSPGVLTVYSGETQIFRSRFRFTEKKGFLRSIAARPGAGVLEETVAMAVGPAALRVYVSFKGDATQSFHLQEELAGGDARTLLVTVDEGGTARIALQ